MGQPLVMAKTMKRKDCFVSIGAILRYSLEDPDIIAKLEERGVTRGEIRKALEAVEEQGKWSKSVIITVTTLARFFLEILQ